MAPSSRGSPRSNNKIEVYDRDTRELAKGDLIRITRNEGEFKNGEVARHCRGRRQGDAGAEAGQKTCRCTKSICRATSIDHAYAQTVHASPGATSSTGPSSTSARLRPRARSSRSGRWRTWPRFRDRSFTWGHAGLRMSCASTPTTRRWRQRPWRPSRTRPVRWKPSGSNERATAITADKVENARCRRSGTVTYKGNPDKMSTLRALVLDWTFARESWRLVPLPVGKSRLV